jgi:hypothetical protein
MVHRNGEIGIPSATRARGGMAMYLVMCFITLVFILGIQYQLVTREARLQAYRYGQSAVLQEIAETAMSEAFRVLNTVGKDNNSDENKFLCSDDVSGKVLEIKTPHAQDFLKAMTFGSFVGEVSVKAKVTKQLKKSKGIYFGEGGKIEGPRCLELTATAEWRQKQSGKIMKSFTISRQHIVIVASLRSRESPRDLQHVPNSCLNYALFVRNARQNQLDAPKAFSPNPGSRVIINPFWEAKEPSSKGGVGKIRLTGKPDQPRVCLNIGVKAEKLLPFIGNKNQRFKVFPKLSADQILDFYPGACHESGLEEISGDLLVGISPVFANLNEVPVYSKSLGLKPDENAEFTSLQEIIRNSASEDSVAPDIELLGEDPKVWESEESRTCIFGEVVQRFMRWTAMRMNLEKCPQKQEFENLYGKWFPVLPERFLNAAIEQFSGNPDPVAIAPAKLEALFGLPESNWFISTFSSVLPYQPGIILDENTKDVPFPPDPEVFCEPDGVRVKDHGYYPFFDTSLHVETFPHAISPSNLSSPKDTLHEDFETMGIIQPKEGLINVSHYHTAVGYKSPAKLILQTDNPKGFTFYGQGIIMADEIVIKSGIKREKSDDFLILVSVFKPIRIETSERIEAFLASPYTFDNSEKGGIQCAKPVNVFGGLMVYDLNVRNWAPGEHRITYDPVFNGQAKGPLFRAAILRRPVFIQYSEK